jgi:hypothetical protein
MTDGIGYSDERQVRQREEMTVRTFGRWCCGWAQSFLPYSLSEASTSGEQPELSCASSNHSIGSGAHETHIWIAKLLGVLLVRPENMVDCIHVERKGFKAELHVLVWFEIPTRK